MLNAETIVSTTIPEPPPDFFKSSIARSTHCRRVRAISAAKIEANRRNALKSTGPTTDAGKQASSRNAIKHGLFSATLVLPEEDAAYAAFCDRYLDQFQPAGLEEENLLQEMIAAQWKLIRLNLVEQGLYDGTRESAVDFRQKPDPNLTDIGLALGDNRWQIERLSRISQLQSRLTREYHRAVKELRQLQKERKSQPAAALEPIPAPEDSSTSSTSSTSSSSFCKTNPPIPQNAGTPLTADAPGNSENPASSANSVPHFTQRKPQPVPSER